MYRLALAPFLLVVPGGCLAKQLQTPAEDHAIQTKVMVERCRGEGAAPYTEAPCSPQLQKDLEKMSEGAVCIEAYAKGERCGGPQ